MSGTTIGVVIALIAGLAAVMLVGWPLLAREDPQLERQIDAETREVDAGTDLREAIERSLAAIREIEQDHRAGNLSDEDFGTLDRAERARAAELMRQRDERAPADDEASSTSTSTPAPDSVSA